MNCLHFLFYTLNDQQKHIMNYYITNISKTVDTQPQMQNYIYILHTHIFCLFFSKKSINNIYSLHFSLPKSFLHNLSANRQITQ